MNKPLSKLLDLTVSSNAWTDNVRQWMTDIGELQSDHEAFRRKIDAAIISLRERGAGNRSPSE